MNRDFTVYLFYIVLAVCLIIGLLVFIILKIKEHIAEQKKPEPIKCGNISVLFDQDMNVTIIPYAKDKYGRGKAVGGPQFLAQPYKPEALGRIVRYSMKLCEGGVTCTDNELMSRLSFKGWKEFSEGKRNISVHYQEKHGIVFNTTRRRDDGAYQFNYNGFEKIVNADARDGELGEILMLLLRRCR